MSRAHRPKAGFWIRLCVVLVYPLDALFFKIKWHHLDRVPADGGVILAINHISQADTIATARLVWDSGRIPRFLIKSSLFSLPVIGTIFSRSGQIPVYRASRDAIQSLQSAIDAVAHGECIVIYPEGTITQQPDYWPMGAKTGIARVALASPGVPVIPIGQWGAHQTLGRGGRFRPFPRHSHQASVGHPVDLERFRHQPSDSATLHEVAAEIMRAITDQVASLRGEHPPEQLFPWTPSPGLRRLNARRNRTSTPRR